MKNENKIKVNCREGTEAIDNADVSSANSQHDKNSRKNEEMDEIISHLVDVIHDKKQRDIEALLDLANKYRKYQKGQYAAKEFLEFMTNLLEVTVNDCDEIIVSFVTGSSSSERKENDNERT